LQTLTLIATWKTKVDVCLITDNEAALQNVLNRWAFPGVQVCSFSTPIVEQWWIYNGQNRTVEAKWNLVWAHREVFEDHFKQGEHTAFLYLEDDTEVTWEALHSWGSDAPLVEAAGLQRGFWRTEVDDNGMEVMMDAGSGVDGSVSEWKRVLEVDCTAGPCCELEDPEAPYWQLREKPRFCQHKHYIALAQTFMGMWLGTRSQLEKWISHPLWTKDFAANYNTTDGEGFVIWQWPERSNAMLQLVDVPEGFVSANVIPWDPVHKILLPIGRIEHERNGYWNTQGPEDLLKT